MLEGINSVPKSLPSLRSSHLATALLLLCGAARRLHDGDALIKNLGVLKQLWGPEPRGRLELGSSLLGTQKHLSHVWTDDVEFHRVNSIEPASKYGIQFWMV